MSLVADVTFGVEPVKVGDVVKDLDVCQLADEMMDALQDVPEGLDVNKETIESAVRVNVVLVKNGFPAIASHPAAYKFAQEVCVRAL